MEKTNIRTIIPMKPAIALSFRNANSFIGLMFDSFYQFFNTLNIVSANYATCCIEEIEDESKKKTIEMAIFLGMNREEDMIYLRSCAKNNIAVDVSKVSDHLLCYMAFDAGSDKAREKFSFSDICTRTDVLVMQLNNERRKTA